MFLRGCCASSSFVSVKISDYPSESVHTRCHFSDRKRPLGTCFVSSFQTSLDFVTLYPFFSFLAMSIVFLSFTSRGKCGILRKYDLHIKIQEREKIKSAGTSEIISIQYPWSLDGRPLWWDHDSRRIARAW